MKKVNLPAPPFLPEHLYKIRAEEDKLPPAEMQLENIYEKTVRIADLEEQEDLRARQQAQVNQARALREQQQEEWGDSDWEVSEDDSEDEEEYEYIEYEEGEEPSEYDEYDGLGLPKG